MLFDTGRSLYRYSELVEEGLEFWKSFGGSSI